MVDFVVNTGQTRVELDKLMQSVAKLGANTDALEAKLDGMGAQWAGTVLKMTGAARDAEARFRALAGEANALKTVLQNADIVNRYSKAMLDLNAAVEQSTLNAIKLESAIQLTNQGYRTAELTAKERLKTTEAGATAEVRSEEAFRRSAIALEQLSTITGRLAAVEAERVSGARAVAVEEQKQANTVALLAEKTELLNSEKGKQAAADKVAYDSAVRMATAEAKQAAALQETAQAIELLQSPEGQRLAQLKATQAALAQQAVFNERQAATTARLRQETQFLASAQGQEQIQLRVTNQVARQAAEEKINHAAKAEALRREIEFLRTEEGKRLLLLQQEAAAERRAAVAVAESTVARSRGINVANQLTSGMRAAIQGLKSSIGIYTSSTILFASAVFGLSRAFRSGLDAGAAYTEAMARTRAVIGGSTEDFKLLESQVVQLGASTPFTTNQVAKAATELGLIGLTAKQAAEALQPILNFSILGDVGIDEAAKQMTDVMLIFGKNVSDMTDLTNVMAVAAARSSATVNQLTLSLSYAGPAAHAMGISMRDTTAAVEVLSNAGIRGERAGTALRRMFVNLANPTTKGAKALAEMGVHILDLDGNAKSLTDILGQLRGGLDKLGGAEKLSKLSDIFGTRAASSMAALLSNMENFVRLRAQLDSTDNAAQEMVSTLRDALTFDYRDLKSAFESLQIKVFADNSYQLRLWVEELREFFTFLSERTNGGATNLERYAVSAMTLGKVLASVFAVKYLTGFISAMNRTATSVNAGYLSYARLAVQMKATEGAFTGVTAKMVQQNVILRTTNALFGQAAVSALATNRAFIAVATGARIITGAVAGLSAVLGWVAIIGTVGYAIWELYKRISGQDVAATASEAEARADELRKKYEDLKKRVDQQTLAQQASAVSADVRKSEDNVKASDAYLLELVQKRHDLAGGNDDLRQSYDKLIAAEMDYRNQQAKSVSAGVRALADIRASMTATVSTESRIQALSKELRDMPYFGRTDAQKARAEEIIGEMVTLQHQLEKTGAAAKTLASPLGIKEFTDKINVALVSDYADALDKAKLSQHDLNAELAEADARSAKAAPQYYAALAVLKSYYDANGKQIASDTEVRKAQDAVTRSLQDWKTAALEAIGLRGQLKSLKADLAESLKDYDFSLLSPSQQKASNAKELAEINTRMKAFRALTPAQRETAPQEQVQQFIDDQRRRSTLIGALTPTRSETKSVDNFLSNLREQLDPIAEAAKKANEQLEKLKSYKGDDKALLAGQIEFTRLKDSLQFSTDPIEKQIQAIEDWKNKQLALNEATKDATVKEQQRIQILREAESAENNLKASLESRKEALEDYVQNLDDQNTALRRQMQDRVSAIGMGQQEAQQQAALTKVYRDQTDAIAKLHTERDRAVKRAMDSDAPNKGSEVEAIKADYAAREQALRDHFAEQVLITKQGYQDLLRAQGSVTLGIKGGLSQVIEDGTNVAGKMSQAVTQGFNDMTDAVVNFAKTSKFSLKAFAADFAEMMLRMELAALEAKLAMMILGLFAPQSTGTVDTGTGQWTNINWGAQYGSTGGTFSGIGAAGAHGLAFDKGSIVAMAKGGLLTRPTLFPMANGGVALGGEAGTEAIMPLGKTPSGDLGIKAMLGGGGGDVFNFQTIVNVNSDGSSQSSTTSDNSRAGRELAGLIEAKAKEVVVRATQPGGILWKQRNGVTA